MDVTALKRSRNRKRKRHSRNKRREQAKLEVRFAKRRKVVSEKHSSVSSAKEKITLMTMQAETFWENYEVAQNWQQRHTVAWWKSRCVALEHENVILKEKMRSLVRESSIHPADLRTFPKRNWEQNVTGSRNSEENHEEENNEEANSDEENLEFQVDEDMMKFFEQTIRHKIELKQKRESDCAAEQAELDRDIPLEGGAAWVRAKTEGAKLLYGDASPRILGMETALQATVDRHKDKAKPQYWPNIPLKL